MPAARVEVTVENGIPKLFCPACGALICDARYEIGERMCAHVLFLYDWDGELWIPERDSHCSPETIESIETVWEGAEHWGEAESLIVNVLSANCLVMCFDEPARDEIDQGSYLAVGLDMSAE